MSKITKIWTNWHVTPEGARKEVYEVDVAGVLEIYYSDPYYVTIDSEGLHVSHTNINKVFEQTEPEVKEEEENTNTRIVEY